MSRLPEVIRNMVNDIISKIRRLYVDEIMPHGRGNLRLSHPSGANLELRNDGRIYYNGEELGTGMSVGVATMPYIGGVQNVTPNAPAVYNIEIPNASDVEQFNLKVKPMRFRVDGELTNTTVNVEMSVPGPTDIETLRNVNSLSASEKVEYSATWFKTYTVEYNQDGFEYASINVSMRIRADPASIFGGHAHGYIFIFDALTGEHFLFHGNGDEGVPFDAAMSYELAVGNFVYDDFILDHSFIMRGSSGTHRLLRVQVSVYSMQSDIYVIDMVADTSARILHKHGVAASPHDHNLNHNVVRLPYPVPNPNVTTSINGTNYITENAGENTVYTIDITPSIISGVNTFTISSTGNISVDLFGTIDGVEE